MRRPTAMVRPAFLLPPYIQDPMVHWFGDARYAEAVLSFLKIGDINEGVIQRYGAPILSYFPTVFTSSPVFTTLYLF